MKILICGLGSIGLRHANNLIKYGYENLIIVTKRKYKFKKAKNIKFYISLKKALDENPDIAFICNSTHKHEETILKCLKKNISLFVEKPIGFKKNRLKKIKEHLTKNKDNINMVGYMMRFHPAIKKINQIIKQKYLGKLFHFSFVWGEYLPNWHKNENYKKSYAANKKMGGGVSLTLSHDLDLAKFLFGDINKVSLIESKIDILKIKAVSSSDFLVKFKNGIVGNIHLDYFQKKPTRIYKIYGSEGKLEFDYYSNEISIKTSKFSKKIIFKKFKRNQLFLEELDYFLKGVKNNNKLSPNIIESIGLLENFKLI